MTILHLISSGGFYGAEAMLVTLAEAEACQGHTVIVAAFLDSRDPHLEVVESAKRRGLAVETVLCSGRWDPEVPQRIALLCDRYAVDLLNSHGYKADFYAKSAAVPLVATCHSWPGNHPIMLAYAILDRRVLRKFDRVVAVAEHVAHSLRSSGIPERQVAVIWNGVDLSRFESATPSLRHERRWGTRPVIGFAGRLVEEKGGRILLESARMVIEDFPSAMFVIAGEGPARAEWETLASELRISENVEFLGAVRDMPAFYSSLDIFALPSYGEAMPMSILEAAAAARPVVATNVTGISNVVAEAVTGHLVDPDDAPALTAALLDLLWQPERSIRWGEAGRARVREQFSSGKTASRYLQLYSDVLAERNAVNPGWKAS